MGPEFNFDMFNINNNESMNNSLDLDLTMFGDVGVRKDSFEKIKVNEDVFRYPWNSHQFQKWTMTLW